VLGRSQLLPECLVGRCMRKQRIERGVSEVGEARPYRSRTDQARQSESFFANRVHAQQQPRHRQEGNVVQPELWARKPLLGTTPLRRVTL